MTVFQQNIFYSQYIYLSQQDFLVPTLIQIKNRNKTMPSLYYVSNNNIHGWIHELTLKTHPHSSH